MVGQEVGMLGRGSGRGSGCRLIRSRLWSEDDSWKENDSVGSISIFADLPPLRRNLSRMSEIVGRRPHTLGFSSGESERHVESYVAEDSRSKD